MSASKNERREAARQRAEQLRTETARREKRARTITILSTVAGLTVLAILVMVIVAQGSKSPIDAVEHQPRNVVNGEVRFGSENPEVELIVFSDYLCPHCKTFETVNADDLKELADVEGVSVSYFPVAFLDRGSQGTKFSTRSANAAMCVADGALDSFVEFNEVMFENQPAQNTPGLTNEEMADIAAAAGAPESVRECIINEEFTDYVSAATQFASTDHDVTGTPTAIINGTQDQDLGLNWSQPGNVKAAVLEELGN